MDEIKTLLTTPYFYLTVGVGAGLGVWWHKMTPSTANLTLVLGVIAVTVAAFLFVPRFLGEQPILVRLLWTITAFCILSLAVYYSLWVSVREDKSPFEASGYLVAAKDPFVQDECSQLIPAEAFRVYLGNSTIWTSGIAPLPSPGSLYPVILTGDTPILSVQKSHEGYIYLSASVIGDDGKFMAKINQNEFIRNPHTTWYQKVSDDKSTLSIYDDRDREVLYVRYMNPQAIKVRGRFNYPGRKTLVITDTEILVPELDQHVNNMCNSALVGGLRF